MCDRWVAPIVDAIRPPKLPNAPGKQQPTQTSKSMSIGGWHLLWMIGGWHLLWMLFDHPNYSKTQGSSSPPKPPSRCQSVGGTYCGCHPTTQTTQSPGEAVANSNLQVDVNRWVAPIVDDRWVAPIVDDRWVAPIVDASGWHVLWMLRDQRAAFYLRCAVEVTKDQPLNRTRPTQNASYKMLANGIQ